jgi:sugar/nucleoside kinase (ribokinase family)
MPLVGETYIAENFKTKSFGGKGANQAMSVARLNTGNYKV